MRTRKQPIFYHKNESTPSYIIEHMGMGSYLCKPYPDGMAFIAKAEHMDIRKNYSTALMDYLKRVGGVPDRKVIAAHTGFSLEWICKALKASDREVKKLQK